MKSTLAMAATVLLFACTDGFEPPAEHEQGLSLLDVGDPSWGLSAAYVDGDRVIYVESRVGPPKPAGYHRDGEPVNEMDLRMIDENGLTFFAQRGGDAFVDPSWEDDVRLAFQATAIDFERRDLDFELARKAAEAIALVAPAGFQDHAFHAANFARQPAPAQDPQMIARAAQLAENPPVQDGTTLYGSWLAFGWVYLWADLYMTPAYPIFGTQIGDHTGVQLWGCYWNGYGCYWAVVTNACNHGSCPGAPDMSHVCSTNGGWKYYPSGDYENSPIGGNVTGACRTNMGLTPGTHLCNDDSAYELWQAKEGTANTSRGNQYGFNWSPFGCMPSPGFNRWHPSCP